MAYTKTNWQDNVTPVSATNLNRIEQGIYDAHAYIDEDVSKFKCSVISADINERPTDVEYRRKTDNTLAIKRLASNPDTNGYYQTVVEKFYNAAGTSVVKTVTYTFAYYSNGIIKTSDGGVVS
jgi:hypothetical protein